MKHKFFALIKLQSEKLPSSFMKQAPGHEGPWKMPYHSFKFGSVDPRDNIIFLEIRSQRTTKKMFSLVQMQLCIRIQNIMRKLLFIWFKSCSVGSGHEEP